MNIKELAEQAGFEVGEVYDIIYRNYENEFIVCSRLERFAELIKQDLYQVIGKSVIEQINSAVLMEREANAKLCEGRLQEGLNFAGCAAAIRQRGDSK